MDRNMYAKAGRIMAAAALLFVAAGCTDLNTEPRSTVSSGTIFNDPASYRAFLARLYAGLAVSGQWGPDGQGDLYGIDEGFGQYLRGYWYLQQVPTDEAVLGWGDAGVPELNTQEWGALNPFVAATYFRIYVQIAMANEFLLETSEGRLNDRGVGEPLRTEIQQYRAEARFLRALSYWHGVDLYANIPFVLEPGREPPPQRSRQDVFSFIDAELQEIWPQLPPIGQAQYGRADQGALLMLLGKLYLNAEAYGVGARYGDARAVVEQVIASGAYQLAPLYMHNFLADNHTSPEIIFAIPSDGENTRTWGGTTFLVQAAIGGPMPRADYGVGGNCCWGGLRTTQQWVALFGGAGGPDSRNSFLYTTGHTLTVDALGPFTSGYAAPKFRNVTSTGAPGSHPTHVDTDFPMFRLADAYLMYAEAVLRGGGGTRSQALDYVNLLRQRAYGDASGHITDAQLTLPFILDERARELFWEAHRRTDLIRYGLFTGAQYLWAFKGGTAAGMGTPDTRNLYPIPAADLAANRNLTQNPGY
jgi:starch-binding outer membrane protein, SusD/RagB family